MASRSAASDSSALWNAITAAWSPRRAMPTTVRSSSFSRTRAMAEARSGWSWTTSTRTGFDGDTLNVGSGTLGTPIEKQRGIDESLGIVFHSDVQYCTDTE